MSASVVTEVVFVWLLCGYLWISCEYLKFEYLIYLLRYGGCISPLRAIRLRLPCTVGGPDSGVNIGDCLGISYWLAPISKSLPNAAILSWPEAQPMARPSLSTITLGSNSNTFRTGATTYLQILMLPPKKTGGLPVALWQLHSVETGSHPHVSRLPDTVNIVVLHPGVITGMGMHQECFYKIVHSTYRVFFLHWYPP